MLADQDRELAAARNQRSRPGSGNIVQAGKVSVVSQSVEQQVAWGSVSSLELHKLTSGLTRQVETDEVHLNLVLQPLDGDGELVKVAGELTVTAAAIGGDGVTRDLITRDYSITKSRELWIRGFVSTGFHVTVVLPGEALALVNKAEDVLVTASLKLGPDRIYRVSELLPPPSME